MIDYLCKYVELQSLKSVTVQAVIIVIKSICVTHGIPGDLINDGGSLFNPDLIRTFF